jgi:hypothetical protein
MPVPLVAMKKILTLGFLLLGLQQVSPQPLPSYDLSYYDSPQCIREKAISFGKSTLIPNKPDEAVGKSICQVAKTAARSSREDMTKRWDTRMFNIVKPGDKVSFTAERDDGVMTIKEITKE